MHDSLENCQGFFSLLTSQWQAYLDISLSRVYVPALSVLFVVGLFNLKFHSSITSFFFFWHDVWMSYVIIEWMVVLLVSLRSIVLGLNHIWLFCFSLILVEIFQLFIIIIFAVVVVLKCWPTLSEGIWFFLVVSGGFLLVFLPPLFSFNAQITKLELGEPRLQRLF